MLVSTTLVVILYVPTPENDVAFEEKVVVRQGRWVPSVSSSLVISQLGAGDPPGGVPLCWKVGSTT